MKSFSTLKMFITVALLTPIPYAWGQDWSLWKHQAEVLAETTSQEYCMLILIPSVYGSCQGNLADIRLVDSDGSQIPYIMFKEKDTVERKEYEPVIVSQTSTSAGAASITADFGAKVIKNTITVETTGFIFRRAVKIEGSPDNQNYFILVPNAYIFAAAHTEGVRRFGRVKMPKNDFRYLKITVIPPASETQPVNIEKVTIEQTEQTAATRLAVDLAQIDHQEDKEQQASSYIHDLQFANIPLTDIQLQIEDEAFYRYVTVEGRDQATRKVEITGEDNRNRFREEEVPWRHLSSGAVYKYRGQDDKNFESLWLSLPNMITPRFLKITIKNYDDKPLTITSTQGQMLPHTLIFPHPAPGPCLMYMGNDKAPPPKYDLALRLTKPETIKANTTALGPIEPNPLWGEPPGATLPWTEQHKILFWCLLALVVLILGVIIGKSLKTILRQPESN